MGQLSLKETPSTTGKILMVDDNEDIREAFQYLMESEGWEVKTASDGFEGLKTLAETPQEDLPNLIVVDYTMPGMDGKEFVKKVRTRQLAPQIPIVIFSAVKEKEVEPVDGIAAWIKKPVEVAKLNEVFERILS